MRTEQGRIFRKIYMKKRIPQGSVVQVRVSRSSGAAVAERGLVRCLRNELRNLYSYLPSMSSPPAHGDLSLLQSSPQVFLEVSKDVPHVLTNKLPLNMPVTHGGPWFPPGCYQPCCCPSRHTRETLGSLHGVLCYFRFGQSWAFPCWCHTCHRGPRLLNSEPHLPSYPAEPLPQGLPLQVNPCE